MRISTKQMQVMGINEILKQQAQLSKTQLQVSTGKRVTKPSDDPVAASRTLDLRQSQEIANQYQFNADAAEARLSLEEGVLNDVVIQIQRVRELALQGNNASQSDVSRGIIATEVRAIVDHMVELANSRDNNNEYLFSGGQGDTRPFARNADGSFSYFGDDSQRLIQIGPTRQVADSDAGSGAFLAIKNGNGSFVVQENSSNTGSGVIDPGSVPNISAYDGDSYTLTMASATTAAAGGAVGVISDDILAPAVDDALVYNLTINGTVVYSQTEADVPLADLDALAAEINDDAGTTGVRAYVDNSTNQLYLANTSPTGNPITIDETLVGGSDNTDTMTGYFGSALSGGLPSHSINLDAEADSYVVVDSLGNVETTGTYAEQADISFNGISTNVKGTPDNGDSFAINPSSNQDLFTTMQNLADILEKAVFDDSDRATLNNTVNNVLSELNQAEDNILRTQASIGTRLNAIDSQRAINDESIFQISETLSAIEDVDYAEAISRLNLQTTTLEAAQQAYIKVESLSLFNFL